MSYNQSTCSTEWECDSFQNCIGGYCVCKPTHYLEDQFCRKCPGIEESCFKTQCCDDLLLSCEYGVCVCKYYLDSSNICRSQIPLYITASQIALSAALIMGMAALTMVVYRLCTKPRYLSARQRALVSQNGINADSDSLTYANYLRASMSSMQIRVLSRLRDRPPAYSSSGSSDARQPAVSLPEAPPPYEGPTEGTSLPPNYTDIVLDPLGYVNSTFVDTEGGVTTSDNNNNVSRQSDCDNVQSGDGNSELHKVTECPIEDKAEPGEEDRIPT